MPILLITTNHFGDQTACGYILDASALVMADGRAKAGRIFRTEFLRAPVALLWGRPRRQWGWSAQTIRSFRLRFELAGHLAGGISYWKARARPRSGVSGG